MCCSSRRFSQIRGLPESVEPKNTNDNLQITCLFVIQILSLAFLCAALVNSYRRMDGEAGRSGMHRGNARNSARRTQSASWRIVCALLMLVSARTSSQVASECAKRGYRS